MKNTKSFNVSSGKIVISDPCYGRDTWCGNYGLPAKNGKWLAGVKMSDEGNWGNRVAELLCWHEDFVKIGDTWENLPNEVGVDSGQAGVFCDSIYPKSKEEQGEYDELDTFYGKACSATLDRKTGRSKDFDIVDNAGVCSSSGYGDGGYPGFCQKDKDGKICAVKIVFLGDDENDIDDDEE